MDGATLAVLNQLENTLTLIALDSFTVTATLPCGEGARALAALPGGFAVANSFADSVTLVDAQTASISATIENVASVPNGVAASASFLGVTTRAPAQLLLYAEGSRTPTLTTALDAAPISIAVLPGDRFVIATKSSLLVVEAATGGVLSNRPGAVDDISVDGDLIVASSPGRVDRLDDSLQLIETIDTPPRRGLSVAAAGGLIALLSPAEKSLQVRGLPPATGAPAPPRAPQPEVRPAPPAPPPAGVPATPQPEAPKLPAVEPATPVAKPVQRARRPAGRPARIPENAFETRAPRFQSPTLEDGRPLAPQSFRLALFTGTALGQDKEGFVPPNWTGEIENVEADTMEGVTHDDGIHYLWEGNARLQLDNTLVQADRMTYNDGTQETTAEGHVILTQEAATLTATRVYYRAVEEDLPAPLTPIQADKEESAVPRKRLSVGLFQAENVHLVETGRELEADYLEYDFVEETGELINVRGRAGVIYFGAEKMTITGPNEYIAHDVWITTCELDPPHYRFRLKEATIRDNRVAIGQNFRLQLGKVNTPLYLPRIKTSGYKNDRNFDYDFDIGHESDIGYFVNFAQWMHVTPNIDLGFRIVPTSEEGIGFGIDGEYDFTDTPSSPLFRGKGSLKSLYTTQESGYIELHHRREFSQRTIVLAQWEQWFERDFVKDFYYEIFRNRTGPRTFFNVTHIEGNQIVTGTIARATNGFTRETEKLPELTYHLLEREVAKNLFVSFDSVNGYYERSSSGAGSARTVNIARLTYDGNINPGLNIAPFLEVQSAWYSDVRGEDSSDFRLTGTAGATLQGRLQRAYKGWQKFAGFKHIFVPSITYSFSPDSTLDPGDTPRFDALDNVPGRSRIESKIENVFLGRDKETNETWQVARISLYQGHDFSNEFRRAEDYELEFDIRPRPQWGFLAAGEIHKISGKSRKFDFRREFFSTFGLNRLDDFLLDVHDRGNDDDSELNRRLGDFDRLLAYFYYDDRVRNGRISGRVGYAFTERDDDVINSEILYGLGFGIGQNWGFAVEHRYDIVRSDLVRQTYELRRRLHHWDMGLRFRTRDSGFDIGIELSLIEFPGVRMKF